jgi:ribosomal protein S18 acetylase RimI-like enzyme
VTTPGRDGPAPERSTGGPGRPIASGTAGKADSPMASETTAGPTVRRGREDDATAVAQLHAGQISEGFLSLLGRSFLRRLYRRIVRSPESFVFVADSEGRVVGFIAGTADVSTLYRTFLLRDGLVAGLTAAPRLLAHWRRVLETVRHGFSSSDGTRHGFELLSVAVDTASARRGIGRALVAAFQQEVSERGSSAAYVVVGADNTPAIDLYERTGFSLSERFELHAGTVSLLLQWELGSTAREGHAQEPN